MKLLLKRRKKEIMKFKPPKGTKDYLPEEMIKRQFVIETIRKKFEDYGFDCLETPVFEDWQMLAKKCGEEVKQQIFRFKDKAGRELGLRFDLTIGMARVIANNPQLPKPFKRYYIGPAWRYEDVTKGRKREFWQADIDIVGSSSMEAEAECLACAVDCLKSLGFKEFKIILNNRKILDGLLELANIPLEKNLQVFRAIDKLQKIGKKGVSEELKKFLNEEQIKRLFKLLAIRGDCEEVLSRAKKLLKGIKIAEDGLEEIREIFELSKTYNFSNFVFIDFSLARGLDYYTGPVFEIRHEASGKIGSVAGGGRYDDLIKILGGQPMPATGISLGIERILQILEEEKMLSLPKTKSKVFVANVDEKLKRKAIEIAQKIRSENIPCRLNLGKRSLSKQLEYANSLKIPFVLIVGEKELKEEKLKLRDMEKGIEREMRLEEVIKFLKSTA
jgi:histidyl-tRNA synthetase